MTPQLFEAIVFLKANSCLRDESLFVAVISSAWKARTEGRIQAHDIHTAELPCLGGWRRLQ